MKSNNPHPLDVEISNYYLKKLKSMSTRIHADLDDFHNALVDLASEIIAMFLSASDQERAIELAIQSLEIHQRLIVEHQSKLVGEVPLTPAEKMGLVKPKVTRDVSSKLALETLSNLESELNLN